MLDAMPPLHDAASRPAMRALAPTWEIDTHPALELPAQPRAMSLEWLRCAVFVIDPPCSGPNDRASPPPASRSNRHRAHCTVGAPSPATSCIAGLPTPAVGARGFVRHGRHPQTFTDSEE